MRNASSRRRFIVGAVAGYAAFGAAWILLSDHLLGFLIRPTTIIEFGVAKGLAFIAVTSALLFVALIALPPEEDAAAAPMETRARYGVVGRIAAAVLPPLTAFVLQWAFWDALRPMTWFLFFPAVFVSSWIGGVFGGVAASALSTGLGWWAFAPPEFSIAVEDPRWGLSAGLFFAMGALFSLTHQRLRLAERRAAETKFRGLVEQALAGIYILQDGRVRYANHEFARMFGYARPLAMIDSLTLADLAEAEEAAALQRDVAACLAADLPALRRNFIGVCRNGGRIDVETHAHRLDYEGRPAIIGVALDVTHRRAAERALQRSESLLRSVVEGSTDAIFVKDTAGRYLLFNQAAANYAQKSPEAVLGRDDYALFPADIAAKLIKRDHETLSDQRVSTHEEVLRTFDGRNMIFSVTKGPILSDDGAPIGVFGVSRDVTENRQAQALLQSMNQRLESEVAARTEELRTAAAEARRLAQSRGAFLANMSHEIRNPLNAMLGLAQVGTARDGVGPAAQAIFRQIVDSGRLLTEIVDEVLDYSKIEAGKLTLENGVIDPGAAMDRAVGMTTERAAQKRLRFIVRESADFPARCRGDALRLSQILVNLLSNAVKFTDIGGEVTLSAAVEAENGVNMLVFKVRDTGIGVPPERLPHLFAPYEQADNTITRRFGGAGLGLSICKRLADAMGGNVAVRSRVGEGSVFELRLPLIDAEPQAPLAQGAAIQGAVIAAYGLDPDERAALADALEPRGVRVIDLDASAQSLDAAAADAGLLLLDAARLDAPDVAAAVERRLNAGRRVALACRLLAGAGLPPQLTERATLIDAPLRARHAAAALTAPVRPTSLGAAETVNGPANGTAARAAGPRLTGVRILIVEDNDVNRLVIREMLEHEGALPVAVADGREAVERVRRDGGDAFDLVLTDVQMPDMDGYETTRRLREIAPALPVIGLSAHVMAEVRQRCLAVGMAEYLSKPVEWEKLTAAALRHCRTAPIGTTQTGTTQTETAAADAPTPPAPIAQTPAAQTPAAQTPAAQTPPDADAQLLDWRGLTARFAARPGFIARLTATVLTSQATAAAELRAAATTGDWDAVAFRAHAVKGMAGNVMSATTQAAATKAESAARRRADDAFVLTMRLADAVDALTAALTVALKTTLTTKMAALPAQETGKTEQDGKTA